MNSINFFTNIETDLANKIPNTSKWFDFYITKINTCMESQPLSINELKDTFASLKINKSPGQDEVSFNVIKNFLVSYVKLSSIYLKFQLFRGFWEKQIDFRCVYWLYKASNTVDHLILLRTKIFCTISNLNSKLAIIRNMPLHNWLTKFTRISKKANIL